VPVPTTAKAAALVGYGRPLEFIDVIVPEELEYGALLVETTMASICASDLHVIDGDVGGGMMDGSFPRIPGHEMTGRVARLGPGVTHDSIGQPLAIGDRIIWTHGFCGQCHECVVMGQPTLCANRRYYMSTRCTEYPYLVGGFAEYCYVFPTSGRVKVPDAVPDELAAAAACALRTIVHGYDRLGPLDDRHSVVIQGSGPLGLFALARAVRSGAKRVIVIGGPAARLEVAARWGATHSLDIDVVTDPAERQAQVVEWTEGLGPDVVIEVAGARPSFPEGFAMLRPGGRYLVIGTLHGDEVAIRPGDIVTRQLTVIGALSGSVAHYHRALRFLADNAEQFSWGDMISTVYPFAEINTALDRMRALEEVKPAIAFA
jgi:L-iditol 2-dehydrogenase